MCKEKLNGNSPLAFLADVCKRMADNHPTVDVPETILYGNFLDVHNTPSNPSNETTNDNNNNLADPSADRTTNNTNNPAYPSAYNTTNGNNNWAYPSSHDITNNPLLRTKFIPIDR